MPGCQLRVRGPALPRRLRKTLLAEEAQSPENFAGDFFGVLLAQGGSEVAIGDQVDDVGNDGHTRSRRGDELVADADVLRAIGELEATVRSKTHADIDRRAEAVPIESEDAAGLCTHASIAQIVVGTTGGNVHGDGHSHGEGANGP